MGAVAGINESTSTQEFINISEWGSSKIKDYRTSYIEILNLKKGLLHEVLEQWLPASGLMWSYQAKIVEVFSDFKTVRHYMTPYPGDEADTSWMVGWPDSALGCAELLEALIYTTEWDPRFRDAIKTKMRVVDFMEYESVKKEFDEILTQVQEEKAALAKALGVPAASAQSTPAAPGESGDNTGAEHAGGDSTGFASLAESAQAYWNRYIEKQIKTYIALIPDCKSQADLENAIRNCPLGSIRGDPTGLVVYHYDVKQHGEPDHRPEVRIAPLRDSAYHRLVRAVLQARAPAGATGHLQSGEVAILLDGGRKGNANKLLSPWRVGTSKEYKSKKDKDEDGAAEEDDDEDAEDNDKPGFVSSSLSLIYTEESIKARKQKPRGSTGAIHQTECALMLAHCRVSLPERARKHFPGSTSGDTIYGITMPALEAEWQLTWGKKKAIFGGKKSGNIIRVGGQANGADGTDTKDERKTDDTVVPICYHGMPPNFYDEMCHTFYAKGIFDLTPLTAKLAWLALTLHIGYIGIVFSEEHKAELIKFLIEKMKKEMADSNSKVYNKDYAKAIGVQTTTAEAEEAAQAKAKAKAKAEAKAKAKAAAKAKALAAAAGTAAAGAAGTEDGGAPPPEAEGEPAIDDDGDLWDPLAGGEDGGS